MEKYLYLLCFLVLFISCHNNDLLYDIVVYRPGSMDNYYDNSPIIIPIVNNDDSVYCCTIPTSFYNQVGVFTFTEEEFTKKVYDKIIANDFIEVSNEVYNELKKYNDIIVEDKEILEMYKNNGILAVLNKYTNEYGEMDYKAMSIEKINYIYYLAFINKIYFYWLDYEGPGYFLDDDILKQLNKGETKIY